jgi:hypothetical protein
MSRRARRFGGGLRSNCCWLGVVPPCRTTKTLDRFRETGDRRILSMPVESRQVQTAPAHGVADEMSSVDAANDRANSQLHWAKASTTAGSLIRSL